MMLVAQKLTKVDANCQHKQIKTFKPYHENKMALRGVEVCHYYSRKNKFRTFN